jgi:hypothetical protein
MIPIDISPEFMAEARRQLEAEAAEAFDRLVKERAIRLQGEAGRIVRGAMDFPHTAADRKAKLDELLAREAQLSPPPPVRLPGQEYLSQAPRVFSAAEEAELVEVRNLIFELSKRCRQDGTIPREAA